MITLAQLHDAWPAEYKAAPEGVAATIAADPESLADPVPSLVDLTLGSALTQCLEDGDVEEMSHLFLQPGKAHAVSKILRKTSPLLAVAVTLLIGILSFDKSNTVDLADYSLSPAQILEILANDVLKKKEVVDLSGNKEITVDILSQLLDLLPNLRRLILLETPLLTSDAMIGFFQDSAVQKKLMNIDAIIHPFLFDRGETGAEWDQVSLVGPFAFHDLQGDPMYGRPPSGVTIPWINPTHIVRSLIDLLSAVAAPANFKGSVPGMVMKVAFGASPRRGEWADRQIPLIPQPLIRVGSRWYFFFSQEPMFRSVEGSSFFGFVRYSPQALEGYRTAHLSRVQTKPNDDEALAEDPEKALVSDQGNLVCDLATFLTKMEEEGGKRPPPELVSELECVLEKLKQKMSPLEQKDLGSVTQRFVKQLP
jgi:hypothetical protein